MDAAQIRTALVDDLYDAALIRIGYADYLRDFEMDFHFSTDPASPLRPWTDTYRFVNCVVADIRTALSESLWRTSLDDRLTGPLDAVPDPADGWVWATRHADMYPGASMVDDSADARHWSDALGIPFYEALFETSSMRIRLVFSDVRIERLDTDEA